jgi:phage gpG-like protein
MARNRGGTDSIKRKIAAFNNLKGTLPTLLGNDAVNFFKNSFRKQGWEDEGMQRWKPRKGEVNAGISRVSKKSGSGRAILVKSGDLKKSIIVELANWRKIRITSNLPYAAIHNEGLKGSAWGKHPFQMPKRKFMGRSRKLHNNLRAKIETKINSAMKA